MKPAAKFLFDTEFDGATAASGQGMSTPMGLRADAAPPPAASAAPPPPTYGEAELAAARKDGHAQGRSAGEAAARASAEHAAAAALAAIEAALPGLARQIDDGLTAASRLMLESTLAGLRRLMPELGRRGGLAEIEGLLEQTIAHLREESRIVVRLNDTQLDGLRARLDAAAQAAGFEGRFVLLADEDIAPGDCRIEWADGGVERTAARVWTSIEAAVLRAVAASTHRPGAAPQGQPGGTHPSATGGSGATTLQET